jgi:hypothetical protein
MSSDCARMDGSSGASADLSVPNGRPGRDAVASVLISARLADPCGPRPGGPLPRPLFPLPPPLVRGPMEISPHAAAQDEVPTINVGPRLSVLASSASHPRRPPTRCDPVWSEPRSARE